MIRRLDDLTADGLQLLKDLRVETNTIVIFTSDNGPHNEAGQHGKYVQDPTFFSSFGPLDGIKRDSWEGGLREPTFVWWPGHIPPGAISYTPSQFQDWMPTFAELAGLPTPARTDGVSLVPTLTGIGAQRRSTIYVEYNFPGRTPAYDQFEPSRRGAVRQLEQVIYLDGYKGVRYNVKSNADDFFIYETLHDPKEITNLAAAGANFPSLQQRMKDRILQLRRPNAEAPRPFDFDLVPPDAVTNLAAGLNYRAFEGAFPWVPDFTLLSAVTNGVCTGLDSGVRTRPHDIGLEFTGYLNVPAPGDYTFYLSAEGKAFLRLHDAALIDADYGYISRKEIEASIPLKAGPHPFCLSCILGIGGDPFLTLQWSGPGISKQAVSAAALLHVAAKLGR
jgi:hypothetical protein